jgi:UDP-3-O-[3-hydroxymyristoyl] glucosamine N-acyltransferase
MLLPEDFETCEIACPELIDDSAYIGLHVITHGEVTIGAASYIDDQCYIEKWVHIGENCHVGARTRIRREVRIGDGARVGSRCDITRDVPSGMVVPSGTVY